MATAFKLASVNGQDNSSLAHEITGIARREIWQVEGVNDINDLASMWAGGLPKPGTGSPETGLDGSTVQSIVRKCTRIDNFSEGAPANNTTESRGFTLIYAVDYSTNFSTPQYIRSDRIQIGTSDLYIPNWRRSTPDVGPPVWLRKEDHVHPRPSFMRIRTRAGVTSPGIDDIMAFDAAHIGDWIQLPGGSLNAPAVKYIYRGTEAVRDQTGFMRLRICYETNAKINAIPSGTQTGWDVSVPVLPALARYTTYQLDPASAPVIGVVLYETAHNQITSIPWDV